MCAWNALTTEWYIIRTPRFTKQLLDICILLYYSCEAVITRFFFFNTTFFSILFVNVFFRPPFQSALFIYFFRYYYYIFSRFTLFPHLVRDVTETMVVRSIKTRNPRLTYRRTRSVTVVSANILLVHTHTELISYYRRKEEQSRGQ